MIEKSYICAVCSLKLYWRSAGFWWTKPKLFKTHTLHKIVKVLQRHSPLDNLTMNITLSQFLFLFFISTGYSRKRINFDKTRSLSRSDWSPNLVSSNDLFAPQNNLSFSASIFLSLVLLFRSFGSKCRKFYIFLNHTLDTASENFLSTRIHSPI